MILWNRKSLASKLSIWYGLSAFLLMMVTTSVLYVSLERAIALQDHQILLEKVRTLGLILENHKGDDSAINARIQEWADRQYERIYVRLLDSNERTLFQTGPAEIFSQISTLKTTGKIDYANHIYRLESLPFDLQKGTASVARLNIALDRTNSERLLENYRRSLALLAILVFAACVAMGWTIARKGVAPIKEISRIAARINSSNLSEHIQLASLPIEFSNLADTFNEMLDRLQEYVSRVAQFSEDIAHELRTPINNLIGEFGVAVQKSRSPVEYQDVLSSGIEECQRIAKIIEALLFVARAENPTNPIPKESFDLQTELIAIKEFYDLPAEEKKINIRLLSDTETPILANKTLFQRAIGNLLSNALTHTPEGGVVTIEAKKINDEIKIDVTDTGPGIDERHLPHIFERFYRVDESRSKDSGGSGLGLAIFKSIVTLHGGSVAISRRLEGGTKVSLSIPV